MDKQAAAVTAADPLDLEVAKPVEGKMASWAVGQVARSVGMAVAR